MINALAILSWVCTSRLAYMTGRFYELRQEGFSAKTARNYFIARDWLIISTVCSLALTALA